MSLGQFVVSSTPYISGLSGVAFNFETMNFDPPGHPADQLVDVEEDLRDVGVDKTRHRLIHQQFPDFNLITTENFSTYIIAGFAQQKYWQANRKMGMLYSTLGGNSWKWKDVKVVRVVPDLQAGTLVGSGVGSSMAVITARWTMRLTDSWGHA